MAIMRWGIDDEEQKRREDPFSLPSTNNSIQSVQSAWQPTQASTNGQTSQQDSENYLMSEEKAQADAVARQRREAEEAARAQAAAEAARRAEMARQAAIARQNEAVARQNAARAQAAADAQARAQAQSAAKYQGGEKPRNEGGFTGFLKDVGAGLQQGLSALGDIAIQGGAVIGSIGKKDQELVRHMENSQRVREWLYGFKDINNQNLRGTSAADEATGRIASGRGDIKDFARVGAVGLQAGIDATMFMNPARLATVGLKPVTTQSMSLLARTAKNPAVRYAMRDAAFFGSLQGTATFQNAYAETGGDLEAAVEAALTDAVIGGTLQGAMDLGAHGVKVGANRTFNSLRRAGRTPTGSPIDEVRLTPARDEGAPVNAPAEDGNITFEPTRPQPTQPTQPTRPQYTPAPDRLSLEPRTRPDGSVIHPNGDVFDAQGNLIGRQGDTLDEAPVADGVANAPEPTPVDSPIDEVELEPAQQPRVDTPSEVTPVADGAVQTPVIPARDANSPITRSEQVRELQDARAGSSQAQEAEINQRLQEVERSTPRVEAKPYILPKTNSTDVTKLGEKDLEYFSKQGYTSITDKFGNTRQIKPVQTDGVERLDSLNPTGGLYVDYTPQTRATMPLADNMTTYDKTAGKMPDELVTIYRGAPSGQKAINPGDFITTNTELAKSYTGEGNVLEMKVPASHILDDVTEPLGEEYLYRPTPKAPKPTPKPEPTPANPLHKKAGIKDTDDYDTVLDKIDDAVENGRITYDEAGRLDDEFFERENAAGRAMAEDGKGNLPDDMTPVTPKAKPKATPTLTPEKQARKDFANVFTRSTDSNSDMNTRLRNATGMTQEDGSEIAQILADGGVTGKQAERITKLFDRAAEIAESNKATQKQYRKDFIKGGKEAIDDAPARQRNRETEEAAYVRNQLNSELKKLERKGDWGEKLTQGFENIISGKNSNQLIGAPIERGLTAEVIGNAMNTMKNPILQARGATKHGIPGKSAVKRLVRELKTPPKTATEGYKYLIGNTYRAAMTPAQALADTRKGALRTELTKYAYKAKIGKTLSSSDAEKVSRMAGNDMEALVNMGAGVDNGTISIFAYRKALKQWKKFIESGSEADYGKFMDTIDRQASIVDKLAQGFSTQGKNRAQRAGLTLVNALLPYMRNAVNMSTRGVVLDLNPFTLSLLDGIRTDQRGFMSNLALGIKNKTVDYAVLAALGSVLTYNDGTDPDTVDQPRGVSIHLGGDEYFSIRGTPLELPLGALMVAKQLAQDGVEGKFKDVGYYGGMITPSIPYVDYMTSHGNVIDSIEKLGSEEGDGGYAAKNFLVGNVKSLTPFSNNNIEASLSRFGEGESLTAKTVYASKEVPDGEGGTKKVADMPQWYLNSLANNNLGKVLPFVPDRSELKDSRDAAGRVRTVDNQGSWMRKKINDADTATHNDTITDLVKFAREEGLGKGTQEMFNTYPDGSENNFKSAQDAITFLDVEEDANGKKTPNPADKLKQNAKLADLNSQIYNGFFGDTGNDLLTLDGQELKSDASVPNADGTKNSKLPLNMQSIKNAIAATDLPEAERNRMYEISQQNQALYAKVESKEWTYAQYKQVKAESEQEYVSILRNSKNFQKMTSLMNKLNETGFFEDGGFGSTKSGQTYLWNSLNALLGSKGATPAANYPKDDKGWTPWGRRGGGGGRGRGTRAVMQPGAQGTHGIKWTPVQRRQMAKVQKGTYTPYKAKVTLRNAIKKDKSQNYSDRTF